MLSTSWYKRTNKTRSGHRQPSLNFPQLLKEIRPQKGRYQCICITSVGRQNLLPKRLFVNAGIPNAWRIFCPILVAQDQLEPLKMHQPCFNISYLWKIPLFWCSFYPDTRFCREKDTQNVVTGWFFTKKWPKWRNSSETLQIDRKIFIGSSKHK